MSHERYRRQSEVTRLGVTKDRLGTLPKNVHDLIEVVAGLMVHFETDGELLESKTVENRKSEIDSRYVANMISVILGLEKTTLDTTRPVKNRMLSTCRDTAVFLCGLLRHSGIPARVRYGFSHVFYEPRQVIHDHVVVEYWTGEKWRIADSRLSETFRARHDLRHLDPVDIPSQLFMSGRDAWKSVRTGQLPAKAFSDLRGDNGYGLWKVRNLLVYDLTSLCGFEPLLWDAWGIMLLQPPGAPPQAPEQFQFLDEVSALGVVTVEECNTLLETFTMAKGVYPEEEIISFSPVRGRHTVRLDIRNRFRG